MQVTEVVPHPSAEDLSALTDAELTSGIRTAVQLHLRSCSVCAAIALSFDEVRHMLRRAGPVPCPSIPTGALPWQRVLPLRV